MSLINDIASWYGKVNQPAHDILRNVDCVLVEDLIVDTTAHAIIHEAVYQRKTITTRQPLTFTDEYVRVVYTEPARQELFWDEFEAPKLAEVSPVEYTAIQFIKKE